MKKFPPLILSLLSGLLLFAAWPLSPLTFLIFIAFVPLLILADQCRKGGHFFGWTYLAMLVWNAATTWWVCNSTVPGGIAAILANSLLMCIPWIGFYRIKKKIPEGWALTALVLFWMSFEYIHLNWQLSWPWLTLGNVFAARPGWVQWYEYTGTSGGSAWIWAINGMVYLLIRTKQASGINRRYLLINIFLLLIPLLFSLFLSARLQSNLSVSVGGPSFSAGGSTASAGSPASISPGNIVLVQPNIDPYEKFETGKEQAEINTLIRISESLIDSNTLLVVWPETAVPVAINEDEMKKNYFLAPVWDFCKRHPSLNLLTGIEGFRFYNAGRETMYSSKIPDSDKYLETYNSAVVMDSASFRVYHKSKLVPGVETLPSFLHFLNAWFEKFGGTTGGYAPQEERTVLNTFNHTYHIAPAVCYESIYGEFMSQYVRNGADLITIITNDGWWGNTAGHRQHENYARLRAIETRRWIARSANTGITCFIAPDGSVINPQPWDKQTGIKYPVPVSDGMTFYARHGDLLSKIALAGMLLITGWSVFLSVKRKLNSSSKSN